MKRLDAFAVLDKETREFDDCLPCVPLKIFTDVDEAIREAKEDEEDFHTDKRVVVKVRIYIPEHRRAER